MEIELFKEGIITNIVYDVTKKILKKNPIRSAIDQTIDELEREKQFGWYELREIDRNQKEFFDNIELIEEATFLKKLIDNGVLSETASKIYKKFSEKFNGKINEAALKEPEVFYPYVIREFKNIKIDNKELIKFLTRQNEIYLDRIIKYFKELERIPINIDIQSVLRKGETKEGAFFKNEPEWVDFEQFFIVERKEVGDIINRLEKDKVQLVLGAPASGKSIILKNVGFKLANKKVYFMELKKHPQDEIKLILEDILRIRDENTILIIDDAHLELSYCERLAKAFKSRGKGNLIIGSRETSEITEEHPKEGAEYELLSELSKTGIHIQAEVAAEKMIRTFLETQYYFDDDLIQTISDDLNEYKNDLWILSWALKSYNKDKECVDKDEIYGNIATSIKKIKVGKYKESINAENVLLPLSIFYRHEIPIERYFLEEQLDIEENIIIQLIGLQEIAEKNKMLSLHHPSDAELYFRVYQWFPDLGRKIKRTILNGKDEEELEYYLFYRYLTTADPKNAVDAVISLGKDKEEMGGKILIKELIKINKIQQNINRGIEKEKDIIKVGKCISMVAWRGGEDGLKLIDNINVKALSLKIDNEDDIEKIKMFLLNMGLTNEDIARKLVENLDIQALSLKIETEDDIIVILSLLSLIAKASEEVGLKLVESINLKNLSDKIEIKNDLKKIELYMSLIAKARKSIAEKIINLLNPKLREEMQERIEL